MKTITITRAFWRYLKRYLKMQWEKQYMLWLNQSRSEVGQPSHGNVKIRTVIVVFWRYSIRYFGTAEKIVKTMYLNGAFWHYLIRYFDLQRKNWKQRSLMVHSDIFWDLCSTTYRHRARPVDPLVLFLPPLLIPSSFLIATLDVLFFSFF